MTAVVLLDAAIDVLLDEIARRLAVRLDLAREREVYTSDRLPPDCRTRRRFAECCRRIPEARKMGRAWAVSREAWERARARRPPTAPPPETTSIDDDADRLLTRAGLRIVVGGSR
jgi:hypothetical protein